MLRGVGRLLGCRGFGGWCCYKGGGREGQYAEREKRKERGGGN